LFTSRAIRRLAEENPAMPNDRKDRRKKLEKKDLDKEED
jgi:hypothetical protein